MNYHFLISKTNFSDIYGKLPGTISIILIIELAQRLRLGNTIGSTVSQMGQKLGILKITFPIVSSKKLSDLFRSFFFFFFFFTQ